MCRGNRHKIIRLIRLLTKILGYMIVVGSHLGLWDLTILRSKIIQVILVDSTMILQKNTCFIIIKHKKLIKKIPNYKY